jgi:hypothetical protein
MRFCIFICSLSRLFVVDNEIPESNIDQHQNQKKEKPTKYNRKIKRSEKGRRKLTIPYMPLQFFVSIDRSINVCLCIGTESDA